MAFPSLPQQILEVLPEDRDEECRGTVTLLITIGIDGKPQKHEIVSSTLAKDECMQRVLDAVYASRWESLPGTADERTYRIRKSYSFK
ncbi:MAG: hypothetical protein JXA28_05985 [Bacteroidetes bacterium]|nr:hypothetical protein [Bacteroidota bacterium]